MEYADTGEGKLNFLKDFGKVYDQVDLDTDSIMPIYDKISVGHAKFMPDQSMPGHQILIDRVFKYVEEVDEKFDKNCSILDVCCGTGIIGRCLRKAGFTGRLEGIDGSKGMLSQAEKLENIYDKLYYEVIKLDGVRILKNQKYDVITVGHAFFFDCLHPEHLDALLELLQPGGLLAFTLNDDVSDAVHIKVIAHLRRMDEKITKLIEDGLCERIFENVVDDAFRRLPYIYPLGSSEFLHDRHICLKKL